MTENPAKMYNDPNFKGFYHQDEPINTMHLIQQLVDQSQYWFEQWTTLRDINDRQLKLINKLKEQIKESNDKT